MNQIRRKQKCCMIPRYYSLRLNSLCKFFYCVTEAVRNLAEKKRMAGKRASRLSVVIELPCNGRRLYYKHVIKIIKKYWPLSTKFYAVL